MENLERIPYEQHLKELKWRQGEHIFVSGATGSGKTTLISGALQRRSHVVMFCVKPHDPTIAKEYSDWNIVDSIRDVERWMDRVIIWPRTRKGGGDEFMAKQQVEFKLAFDVLMKQKGWCIFVDEANYMANPKFGGVGKQIEMLHYVGRSSGISMVSLAQRPAYVPLAILSNVSHAYLGRSRVQNDLKRLADLGNVDPREIQREMAKLPTKHDFLYTPTQGEGRPGIVNARK